jgi:Tfp pilus assembly protein PilF
MKRISLLINAVSVLGVALGILLLTSCAPSSRLKAQDDAKLHYLTGVSFLETNEYQKAFVKFQEAIRFDPKHKEALNSLGYISALRKDYDNAIMYYKRAIMIDPDYSEAMNSLGLIYMDLENWDEAIKYYRRALQNPEYSTPEKPRTGIGYALYKKKDYAGSEKVLREVITQYSESYFPLYVLGLVYTAQNRIEDAIEMYIKSLELAPYYIKARWQLAHAYMRVGENVKAYEHFQLIEKTEGDNKRGAEARRYMEMLVEP